jgi:hypothetical protein
MKYLVPFVTRIFITGLLATTAVYPQTLPMVHDPIAPGITGYNITIPEPDAVLGYRIGEKHTYHHLIAEYFQRVADRSDRVVFGEHGRTYDGNRLIHGVVTSPDNHARIEEIKRMNRMLSESPASVPESQLTGMPSVVWMGYGVHGNEASSYEAALLLLYHLAAGEGAELENLLKDLVILIIPSLNPDGHNRHAHWVNTNRGSVPTADPHHREHNEPWPGGRTNYYWFDLNRDWFPLQHPESQGRMELYNTWRPQMVTDFHEFGSNATYFFQPGISSRYNPHIPEGSITLLKEVGEYHAAALDERGVLYYTRESFDDFYIGKGSTYPMVTGAIGILFEQAAARALMRETSRGELSFGFTILNQFTTSLSTLRACYQLREELLKNHRSFYLDSTEYARRKGVRAFIIDTDTDPARAQELLRILRQHRVRINELAQTVRHDGKIFEPDKAVVISTEQPEARLIFAALETRTEFEDSLFYDISTWTLPLAFNLPYAKYRQNPARLLGKEITSRQRNDNKVHGGVSSYAYIFEWNRYYASRALYRLQKNNVQTMVAMRSFSVRINTEIREFGRGTIIIPVSHQQITADMLHDLIKEVTENDEIPVYALQSSRTVDGPDLGSPSNRLLQKPEVAVLSGPGVSSSEVGEVWHLLNKRMQMPVTLLNVDAVQSADLRRYTTIIMVQGNYNTLSGQGADRIKEWIQDGGTLITTKNATRLIIQQGLLEIELIENDIASDDLPYDEVWSARGANIIGGAIFKARIDNTHPVGFGYGESVPLFRNHTVFYKNTGTSGTTVAMYTDNPLLSGYISNRRLAELTNTAAIFAQRYRQGRIIAFADNPNFRAFWYGTNGLFLNAIFFGGMF